MLEMNLSCPPSKPDSPMVGIPFDLAYSAARITFGELPDDEIKINKSCGPAN